MSLILFYSIRREYPQLSLLQLQRLLDLGRVDPTQPIDLTTLCNTKIISMDLQLNQYGINLTDEVGEHTVALVKVHVCWATNAKRAKDSI